MDGKMKNTISSELELKRWFEKNFKKLGYKKILKKDFGKFPDFLMLKNNKNVRVELETLSSNFILHKHNIKNVDEVVCIKKDANIKVKLIELKNLKYHSKIKRISATISEETANLITILFSI